MRANVVGGPCCGSYKPVRADQRDGFHRLFRDHKFQAQHSYYWHRDLQRWLCAALWFVVLDRRCQGK